MLFTKPKRESTNDNIFEGYICTPTSSNIYNIDQAMERLSRKMENATRYKRRTHGPFKVSMCVYQKYSKTFEGKTIITDSLKVSNGHMHLFHYESVAQLIRDLIHGHKRN